MAFARLTIEQAAERLATTTRRLRMWLRANLADDSGRPYCARAARYAHVVPREEWARVEQLPAMKKEG